MMEQRRGSFVLSWDFAQKSITWLIFEIVSAKAKDESVLSFGVFKVEKLVFFVTVFKHSMLSILHPQLMSMGCFTSLKVDWKKWRKWI